MSYDALDILYTAAKAAINELQAWVNDLQSGMYINCVYCGHRYGPEPETPVAMADVLKEHIEKCPKHPMSILKIENEHLKAALQHYQELAFLNAKQLEEK